MANQLYPTGAGHLLGAATQVNLVSDTIKVLFYSSAFSSAHEFVSDLTGASIIARSGALSGKVVTNGVFDANDITISSVSGSAFAHVILFDNQTGVDASSQLLAHYDVSTFTPSGTSITVVFNASGLFSIA